MAVTNRCGDVACQVLSVWVCHGETKVKFFRRIVQKYLSNSYFLSYSNLLVKYIKLAGSNLVTYFRYRFSLFWVAIKEVNYRDKDYSVRIKRVVSGFAGIGGFVREAHGESRGDHHRLTC